MNLVMFLFIGLIAGFLAGKIVEGRGFGALGDIGIGIIGSFVGGVLLGPYLPITYGFWGAIMTATLGAVGLLVVANLFRAPFTVRRTKY